MKLLNVNVNDFFAFSARPDLKTVQINVDDNSRWTFCYRHPILGWPTWLVGQLFDKFDTENESMKALEWVLRAVRIFSSASLHRNEAEGDERRGDWRGRNRLAWKPHRPLGRFRSNQSWTRRFNEPTDQRWSQGGHISRRRRTSGAQTKGCQPFSRHLIGWLRCKLANPLINWRLAKTTSRSPVAARHLGSNAISL